MRADLAVPPLAKSNERHVAAGRLAFHRCPPDPTCAYCGSDGAVRGDAFDWSFLDAVYCISLQSRDDRAAQAAHEFHRVGLCRAVVFCRPVKEDRTPKKNIWRSHRFVARHARKAGAHRALILEDDVVFARGLTPARLREVGAAIEGLPADWMGFYLGHWPLRSWFVGPHRLRTSSLCTHAYVASRRLIQWICRHPCRMEPAARPSFRERVRGRGIDAAFAELPGMYAFHPMIAFQRPSPNDHVMRSEDPRELGSRVARRRLREYLIANHLRTAERVAVALSPITRRLWTRADAPSAADVRPPSPGAGTGSSRC